MNDVVIVGAGPAGLMLACELRLHGVDVVVLERDASPTLEVRSLGMHVRSIEILDQRGLLDRFLEHGTRYDRTGSFAGIVRPWPDDLDTAHPYLLGIPQTLTDRLLEEHALALGVQLHRGRTVVGVRQDVDAARLELDDGSALIARFVVGCDGGRSTVRNAMGIGFPGEPPQHEWLLGSMELTSSPEEVATVVAGVRRSTSGFGVGPSSDGGYRIVVPAATVSEDRSVAPTLDEVAAQLRRYAGTDFGVHSPRWISRFTDATRLADHYRVGRVFIAGDAAHVHPPLGGHGLGLGIQDAFNLGWKLAAEIDGWAPPGLLDTYESERRPVDRDVLTMTRAHSELTSGTPGADAVRQIIEQLAEFEVVNRALIERVTGIGVRYDFGSQDARIGRRQRDIPLADGTLYDHLHAGRGLLLDRSGLLPLDGWSDRVDRVDLAPDVPGATSMLLRPDGHIAWIGDRHDDLVPHLLTWFGQPRV